MFPKLLLARGGVYKMAKVFKPNTKTVELFSLVSSLHSRTSNTRVHKVRKREISRLKHTTGSSTLTLWNC